MNPKRGYYSLLQFCPEPSRAEAVNLGVLLFCPDAGFIGARTSASNQRARKLAGAGTVDSASVNSAKRALERRLKVDRESFRTLDDLQHFVDTRANILKLTQPRPIKVFEPATDLAKLFDELVGGRARREATKPVLPLLDDVFRRLEKQGRAQLNLPVTVPLAGRRLCVPYAYRNGILNLVLPHRFANQDAPALNTAMRLAIEGDLLGRYVTDDLGEKQLVVIPTFQANGNDQSIEDRVVKLLRDYRIGIVPENQVDAFARQVEQEAH